MRVVIIEFDWTTMPYCKYRYILINAIVRSRLSFLLPGIEFSEAFL